MGEEACGLRVVVTIPGLRIFGEMNRRDHWAVRRARFADHKLAVAAALSHVGSADQSRLRNAPVITVKFVRIGGKKLDPDNLVSGFKACLDQVCTWLRIDDGSDRLKLEWPTQESGTFGVRLEMTAEVT